MARGESFQEGDVVQLKSGGPDMTVSEVEDGSVTCRWFEGKTMNGGVFTPAVLKLMLRE